MMKTRPYQVALTTDPTLPLRKWDHKGTFHSYTHLSAAYDATDFTANHVAGNGKNYGHHTGTIIEFENGIFAHVGF